MKLRPLGDRVVVRPIDREDVTKSGIVLPETAKEKPQEGRVESVGAGRVLDDGTKVSIELDVGDRVLYANYAGTEFKLDETDYLILSEKDVLAVILGKAAKAKKQSRPGG